MKRLSFLWLVCLSAHAGQMNCSARIVGAPLRIAQLYDAYMDARVPQFAELQLNTWKLTGISVPEGSPIHLGTDYNVSGYLVGDVVPAFDFKTYEQLRAEGEYPVLLSYTQGQLWVIRKNWGIPNHEPLVPTVALYPLDWKESHPLKQNSLTFALPLYGEKTLSPFLSLEDSAQGVNRLQMHCRLAGSQLICLGNQTLGKLYRTALFMVFEPVPE